MFQPRTGKSRSKRDPKLNTLSKNHRRRLMIVKDARDDERVLIEAQHWANWEKGKPMIPKTRSERKKF